MLAPLGTSVLPVILKTKGAITSWSFHSFYNATLKKMLTTKKYQLTFKSRSIISPLIILPNIPLASQYWVTDV